MGSFSTSEVGDKWWERALSYLFPIILPSIVETTPEAWQYDEQGECGAARRKLYRDAIDRHWQQVGK